MSIAVMGLIGVGVHATFTSNTSSGQTITAGTSDPTLSGSCLSGSNCPTVSNALYTLSSDGTILTFAPTAPASSSFTSGDEQVTATNTGNLPLSDPTWVVNATGGSDLAIQAFVCVTSTGIGTNVTNTVLYNGPLSGFTGTTYSLSSDILTPTGPATATSGPTDNLVVDVYAGAEPTLCGSITTAGTTATPGTSTAPVISGAAIGENIAVSVQLTYHD
jgi:predicted ribosomally synthesized peptide with SipW-like signal peptide